MSLLKTIREKSRNAATPLRFFIASCIFIFISSFPPMFVKNESWFFAIKFPAFIGYLSVISEMYHILARSFRDILVFPPEIINGLYQIRYYVTRQRIILTFLSFFVTLLIAWIGSYVLLTAHRIYADKIKIDHTNRITYFWGKLKRSLPLLLLFILGVIIAGMNMSP